MNASKNSSRKRQSSITANNNSRSNDVVDAEDENAAAGEYLLDRIRILLNRLQTTAEILQNWPDAKGGDDSRRVHAETSAELIASVRKIALGARSVERHVNGAGAGDGGGGGGSASSTEAFRKSLEEEYPIPLDLLDLLDVGQPTFGINPQCYARGLMLEALRQLSVLERRKRALGMLARSIEGGMTSDNDDDAAAAAVRARGAKGEMAGGGDNEDDAPNNNNKRKRDDRESDIDGPAKKIRQASSG
ncbi:hypothetical protein ACHAW5_004367 [Stephanodiscus triporus]|uniref:Mediator of RNA polymerase II transcription subunit 10 n=1 Tax=Stephanodiscus triporus TaxID=2934178 RepID=A0ABD3Q3V3_9STRA